ncbi:hypothetical protein BHM03_00026111 [Ensete ventricosum]|nr:hypothetical protein BHM03_00026111 [Ensete ventricosum]
MNEVWLVEASLSSTPRGMVFPFVIYAEFFLIVPHHAEMFNVRKMKSDSGAGSGSTVSSSASAPATIDVGAPTAKKHPNIEEGAGLRKRLRKAAPEQPVDALRSTARTSAEKGKGIVELKDVPEWGYIIRELCEVEDRARADKYFASIMIQLKSVDNQDPLVTRWGHLRFANKDLKLSVNQELVTTAEHRVKEWEDEAKKLWTELESLRNQQRELEQERDVLSLTEAAAFLKAEGPKAVTAYKVSRGFELGLKEMGRVSYKFRYRAALERLRGKHLEIVIEQDPFAECPDDTNVEMDLNQPFDDSAPSEKYLSL